MVEEKAEVEVANAEVVSEAKTLPEGMTESQYEGLEKDLKAYQEKRMAAWKNSYKNKAAHVAKVFAKRTAAAKAAKKARKAQYKIQRKRK